MQKARLLLASALLLSSACSTGSETLDASGPGSDAAAPDTGAADAGTTDAGSGADASTPDSGPCIGTAGRGTVHGTEIDTYVTDTGTISEGADLTGDTITVWAPSGPGGCFARYTGSATTDGTFSIPGIPDAVPLYLRIDDPATPIYVVTTNMGDLDLGGDLLGRPDTVEALDPNTALGLNLTGLNAWNDNDDMELFSFGAGAFAYALPQVTDASPNPAATTFASDLGYNTDNVYPVDLIQGSQGDRLWITQLATETTTSGQTYQSLVRAGASNAINMIDGRSTTVALALNTIAASEQLRLHWDVAGLTALSSALNPTTVVDDYNVTVEAIPEVSRGVYGQAADLLEIYTDGTQATVDDTFSYGNPFSAQIGRFVDARLDAHVNVALGGTPSAEYPLAISTTRLLEPGMSSMSVVVGPAQHLAVNGANAFAVQSGVGVSPMVSWDAPAVGQAHGYVLTVVHLTNDAGTTNWSAAAQIYTAGTSVQIPPDVMAAGETYRFELDAVHAPGLDLARHPFRTALPYGTASVLSAPISP